MQRAGRVKRLRKSVITSARLIADRMKGGPAVQRGRWAMVTLTYRDESEWQPRQIADFFKRIREWARRSGWSPRYVWVLELTARMRPHFHVLFWLPKGRTMPKPDKRGWWPWGSTRIEWARHAVGYLAKYATKCSPEWADAYPPGARIHGRSQLDPADRPELRWWMAPTWLRRLWPAICDVRRIPGGWVRVDTGECASSPFRVVWYGGALNLCEVVQ